MKVLLDENITPKSIPPMAELDIYYGLIWLRGFQVTKKTYESVMDVIGLFLKNKEDSVKNTYYVVKKKQDSYEIIQRYPKATKGIS